MTAIRRLGLGIAVTLFIASLSATAIGISLFMVFNTPQTIKRALIDSNLYTLSPASLTTTPEDSDTTSLLSDPGVQKAFTQAFSPSFIQQSSEKAINGIYDWIQGATRNPEFSIDLTEPKTNFANNVASYLQQKIEGLPPCALFSVPPTTITELLNLTCKPRGVTSASIAAQARQEVLRSDVIAHTITADSLKDPEGRSVFSQLSFIPTVYTYLKIALYILPFLTLLLAIAIVYLSQTKRSGLRRTAWLLISIGTATTLFALAGEWFLQLFTVLFGTPTTAIPALQDKFISLIEMLVKDLRHWWLSFGIAYILLGCIIFIILALNRPKSTLTTGNQPSKEHYSSL